MASPELSQRLSEYASNLVLSNKRRYLEKVSGIGDPYCIPAEQLHTEGLLGPGREFYTSEKFKAFKSLETYKYLESGFVNVLGVKNLMTIIEL